MFMCRVFSCVVGRGCLILSVRSLGKTLLGFVLLHFVLQGQVCLLLLVSLEFLLLHPIPQGHHGAPALSTLSHASNLDWRSVSHMIIYMFQCYFLKSSHPRLFPHSPKDWSIHLCLFCCLTYRVIVTIFLNSIYMC